MTRESDESRRPRPILRQRQQGITTERNSTAYPARDVVAYLLRYCVRKTFQHQFRVLAIRAPKKAAAQRKAPIPERWQRYRVEPRLVPGLAAVKDAQQRSERREPQRPEGPLSKAALFEWYRRQGMEAVYFVLFPGG